jgi:hypothetical protein
MALAVPRIRLRLPVPVASRRARSLAWRLRMGTGDTMKDFAADDLQAADLLALARLDDDGAPPAATRPRRAAPVRVPRRLRPALAVPARPASGPGPAGVPAGPVIAAVADGGQAWRAEHVCGRR